MEKIISDETSSLPCFFTTRDQRREETLFNDFGRMKHRVTATSHLVVSRTLPRIQIIKAFKDAVIT